MIDVNSCQLPIVTSVRIVTTTSIVTRVFLTPPVSGTCLKSRVPEKEREM